MNRRELLATLAAGTLAVPGCLDDSNGAGDGTPSATPAQTPTLTVPSGTVGDTPSGTRDTDDAPTGTDPGPNGEFVREAFAVPELAAPNSPDSLGVYGERGEQYVVALLNGPAAGWPAVDEVGLVADGTAHDAKNSAGYGGWGLFDYGGAYAPDHESSGWVVFRLPNPLDVEDATITWPGGEYALGDDALADLARPPTSFEVVSFDAPAAVEPGESFTLSLTVENTGDADGTFVGAVNRNFPAYAPVASIRLSVPAGETATWERTVETGHIGPEGGQLRLWLYWRDDAGDREVTVDVGSGTETADGTVTQGTRPPDTRTDPGEANGTATATPPGTPTPLDE